MSHLSFENEWPATAAAPLIESAWNERKLDSFILGATMSEQWASENGEITTLRYLGGGWQGKVAELIHHDSTGHMSYMCAVKFIQEKIDSNRIGELRVLKNIPASANVVRYYGWHRLIAQGTAITVVFMELCAGDLRHFIDSGSFLTLDPYQKLVAMWDIVSQIARGLQECYHQGILHRDLKKENILYTGPIGINNAYLFKIGDFGLARELSPPDLGILSRQYPPLPYIAPEVYNGLYDYRSELFSLGYLMNELVAATAINDYVFIGMSQRLSDPEPALRPSLNDISNLAFAKLQNATVQSPVARRISALIHNS